MNKEPKKVIVLKKEYRCHNCKETKSITHFYVTKKELINTYKCKACYKREFNDLIRDYPL